MPIPGPDHNQETQVMDLSPVAKNLRGQFQALGSVSEPSKPLDPSAEPPTQPLTVPGPSMEQQAETPLEDAPKEPSPVAADMAVEEDSGNPDLFFAEAKDFTTREAQFGEQAPPRPKAQAKAKSKGKPSPKAKGKAKSKPKAKAAAAKAKAKANGKGKGKDKGKRGRGAAKAKAKSVQKKKKTKTAAQDKDDNGWETDEVEEVHSDASEKPCSKRSRSPEDLETKQSSTNKPSPKSKGCKATAKAPKETPKTKEKSEKKEKASFARRYRPMKDAWAGQKWDQLKAAFCLHIQPKVVRPSSLEVGWSTGMCHDRYS